MPERPSKKQRQLLEFIERFIDEHGYGPSYREIMDGCNYTSVATVALHVNNLTSKGHLRKHGRSARSLEIVKSAKPPGADEHAGETVREKWLEGLIGAKLKEAQKDPTPANLDKAGTLIGALEILGFKDAAADFQKSFEEIKPADR